MVGVATVSAYRGIQGISQSRAMSRYEVRSTPANPAMESSTCPARPAGAWCQATECGFSKLCCRNPAFSASNLELPSQI